MIDYSIVSFNSPTGDDVKPFWEFAINIVFDYFVPFWVFVLPYLVALGVAFLGFRVIRSYIF